MKKASFLLLMLVLIITAAKAQDVITLTNGTQIQAKVLEVNPGDIKYKDYNNQDGPTITILKSSVSSVKYQNGTTTVFNESSERPNSGHFERGKGRDQEVYSSYRRKTDRNSHLKGWYFGVNVDFGISSVSSNDPNYSVSGGGYAGLNIMATYMFNQHVGLQFGIGDQDYDYGVNFYSGYGSDGFTASYIDIPVRAIYFSNSKKRAGFYGSVGLDLAILSYGTDNEGDDLSNYYSPVIISPYVSCGVEFRSRNARGFWMLGPYYRTNIGNFYSGNSDINGYLAPGNSGYVSSIGLSITYMMKFRGQRF